MLKPVSVGDTPRKMRRDLTIPQSSSPTSAMQGNKIRRGEIETLGFKTAWLGGLLTYGFSTIADIDVSAIG